jgi:16S rRNA (uracil1498-N3)-methyltransferase
MPKTPRLYLDTPLGDGATVAVDEGQAHYLRTVLRRGPGDAVLVFNARDGEFSGSLLSLAKRGAEVSLSARVRAPETEPDLWLLFAAVKRDAVDLIAQKATELGVSRLQPVATERTNAARVNSARLASIAKEAAEQCGRLSIPVVMEATALSTVLADWPEDRRLMYCDESGDAESEEWGGRAGRAMPALEALGRASEGPWAILIGPEGGFSPDERKRLRGLPFVAPVTLGPRILRADTAAIAAIVLWQAALGDLKRS